VSSRPGAGYGYRRSPATKPGYNQGRRPANAGRTYPVEVLTVREVSALLASCSPRSATGVRNRALIVVLYRGGLRFSEALALESRDVDEGESSVNVRHGKGDRQRVVGMDPQAFALLERWLELRRKRGLARTPIFCTLDGRKAVDSSYVRRLLPRLAAAAASRSACMPTASAIHTRTSWPTRRCPLTASRRSSATEAWQPPTATCNTSHRTSSSKR